MSRRASLAAAALLAACARPPLPFEVALRDELARADFEGAAARVEAARGSVYGPGDAVLLALDRGAALHDAGLHAESAAALEEALAAVAAPPAPGAYRPAAWEVALARVYLALDRAQLGDPSAADAILPVPATEEGFAAAEPHAFPRLLAALLLEDVGRDEEAARARAAAEAAYAAAGLGVPPPAPAPGPGTGELVVIHWAGRAPRRAPLALDVARAQAEAVVRGARGQGDAAPGAAPASALADDAVAVPWTAVVREPARVVRSRVAAGGAARETIVAWDVAADALREAALGEPAARAAAILRAAAAGFSAPRAPDLRAWSTAAGALRLARLALPEGVHEVHVVHLSEGARVLRADVVEGVRIDAGRRTYLHVRTAE